MLNVPTKFTAPAALVPTKLTGNVVSGDPAFTFCAVTVGTTIHKLMRATISPSETSFLLILVSSHGSILSLLSKLGGFLPTGPLREEIEGDRTRRAEWVEQRAYLLAA